MREIVVISGKGGTGKTSVCSAFAHLLRNGVVCDLDVDAPDMHIILEPEVLQSEAFISGNTAIIQQDDCLRCGECLHRCNFNAISQQQDGSYHIDASQCEGCGVCFELCPAKAIDFPEKNCGEWHFSRTRFAPFIHAQLTPGEENSGRLVSLLKSKARDYARENNLETILCDGSPGIGCPVISSLSGATLAVAVVEPTPSGRHDFSRVAELCAHFNIPIAVIINKADLNPTECAAIKNYCTEKGYSLAGTLPFSNSVLTAMLDKKAITETDTPLADALRSAWANINTLLDQQRSSHQLFKMEK